MIAERRRHDVRVDIVRAGDDREREREIVDVPCERADVRERFRWAGEVDDVPRAGDAAGGRLDPRDPAEVRRHADAAARVAADIER